jgi:hypothetical protein
MPPRSNRRPVRAVPKPNGFWPISWDTILREGVCVCQTCGGLLIASDKSMNLHRESHR